jgi:hypothetical protein
LGVSPDREAETTHSGPLEGGGHLYGGWHHFLGHIVAGKGAAGFLQLSSDFSVWFHSSKSCAEPVFMGAPDVVQVEFSTLVPWVLSDEPSPL